MDTMKFHHYLTPYLKLLAEGISIASRGLENRNLRAKAHKNSHFWELIGQNEI